MVLPLDFGGLTANKSHKTAFVEIWLDDVYCLRELINTKVGCVVDIGANIGLFSVLACRLFPEAVVYAYDPVEQLEHWRALTKRHPNLTFLNLPVSNKNEKVLLNKCNDDVLGVVVPNSEGVSCIPFNDIEPINRGDIVDFLKIDCEGFEWRILLDPSFPWRQIRTLAIEYHLWALDADYEGLIRVLFEKNFVITYEENSGEYGILVAKSALLANEGVR